MAHVINNIEVKPRKIFELHGKKYQIILGPEGCKPCDLCDVRKECESDDYEWNDDFLMLCGCEFCTKPYYVKEVK